MVSSYAQTKEASQAKYISILNIIQGEVDPTQVMSQQHWKFFVRIFPTIPIQLIVYRN
jgi:hypothetical protein